MRIESVSMLNVTARGRLCLCVSFDASRDRSRVAPQMWWLLEDPRISDRVVNDAFHGFPSICIASSSAPELHIL